METPGNPRALPAEELRDAVAEVNPSRGGGQKYQRSSPKDSERADKEDAVIIFGSLSFLKDAVKQFHVRVRKMTKNKMDKEKIEEGVRLILEGIGEDINREGLLETPDRIARMYKELAAGYTDDAAKHLKKRFHVDNNDMVLEKDILLFLLRTPYAAFLRYRIIAYIPNGEVVGLSKMARTVEVFAKRFQLQERPPRRWRMLLWRS